MKKRYTKPQSIAVELSSAALLAASDFGTMLSSKRPNGETGDAITAPSDNQFSKRYNFDAFED